MSLRGSRPWMLRFSNTALAMSLCPALLGGLSAGCTSESKPATDDGVTDDGTAPAPTPTPTPSGKRMPPPLTGGTLLVTSDGKRAVASDPDRDAVYVVDLATKTIAATIKLTPGDEPGRLVEDAEGRVHIGLRGGGAVLTVNTADGAVVGRRELCAAPRGLAFDKSRNLLHVACAGGELISIAPTSNTPSRSLMVERDLRDVVVAGDKLVVSSFKKADVMTIGEDGSVARRLAPASRPMAAFAFTNGKVFPGGMTGEAQLSRPGVAWRLMPAAEGSSKVVMLHQRAADTELGTQPGGYVSEGCTGFVEGGMTAFDPGSTDAKESVRSGPALAGVVLPIDMALAPNGKQIAVVTAGNRSSGQQVQFVAMSEATDTSPDKPCVPPAPIPEPPAPEEPAPVDPETGLPAPAAYLPPNGEVIAVAWDRRGNVLVQSREPATLQILTQRSEPIVLSTESKNDVGHQLFHTATQGKMACASCHPEGGEDGRVWRFQGIGGRRTQSLRGGIMDTAPFHWDGDLTGLPHLMTTVFQGRMGGQPVERPRVDALADWMNGIPNVRLSKWNADDSVNRGRALFAGEAGCAACHSGKHLTDNKSVNVGTGGRFQTPQLHNLAFRAPFMHDGCAGTLTERFTKCGGGDAHGKTSHLTPEQVADLVAYLETL